MSSKLKLNLKSARAKKARLSAVIGNTGAKLLWAVGLASIASAIGLLVYGGLDRASYGLLVAACACLSLALWYQRDLKNLAPQPKSTSLDGLLEANLLAKLGKKPQLDTARAWRAATSTWQGRFLCNHLLVDAGAVGSMLVRQPTAPGPPWSESLQLAAAYENQPPDGASLAAAILQHSVLVENYLSSLNLKPEDVTEALNWQRRLAQYLSQPHPYFGGIGRDWAAGFTPTLERYGQNISRIVEHGGGHFHTLAHADSLDGLVHELGQGAGSLALVGEAGTGKTSLVYGLAERLLRGKDQQLLYHQIFTLDASAILAAQQDQLEKVLLSLFGEAVQAGNIILFLDDAELFFGDGTGAFDLSQVLLPVLQNKRVKIIAAMTPKVFQRLKSSRGALMSQMSQITISEPPQDQTLKILQDTALSLEQKSHLLVSLQAINEAYRLSGQYEQDLSYPGKAIRLLEQAVAYAEQGIMAAESVQATVEKIHGVKVAKAQAPEAQTLLKLEEIIHQRMINQKPAVEVVAAALRRGRAGVANPNRPIGSFLFLGPTGVGKTELARSLAAAYFGNAKQMVRLDMSEYQQTMDAARLLEPGNDKAGSLIMSIRRQPFSVVLLDEIEKAHPSILNLLLQMLDEGQLTDQDGRATSFKNAIIILTSNAGSAEITQRVAAGDSLESFERPLIDKLIQEGIFKAELVNRFDDVVLFRPLNKQELAKVAELMLAEVNQTLAKQNVSVKLTDEALAKVVELGFDPQFGARPMRRAIQKLVEDVVAKKILIGEAKAGSTITLDVQDLAT